MTFESYNCPDYIVNCAIYGHEKKKEKWYKLSSLRGLGLIEVTMNHHPVWISVIETHKI